MVRKSSPDITALVDSLIEGNFFSGLGEELDKDTLKLLDYYEMQSTMNSVTTLPAMGNLDVGPDNTFSATFTEEGSGAVQSVEYMGDTLSVVYRSNSGMTYQYAASEAVLGDILNEVKSTLIDGEGSVGSLISRLKNTNAIQLI